MNTSSRFRVSPVLKNLLLVIFFVLSCPITSKLLAQSFQVKGKIEDSADKKGQVGVIIILQSISDSNLRHTTITDTAGIFKFQQIKIGSYKLIAEMLGYKTFQKEQVINADSDLGTISLETDAAVLKEVKVEGLEVRAKQKGDTTEYNSRAFKVNPDASAQDLITKMPGVTLENGTVKAQGEDVKKILVDGKEFFGNDVNSALRNIPADAIDKIQVFDRMNEQSRLTGFNDGNTEKSINITTKPGMSNGTFGRVFAGYGTDDRYSAGGNINWFNKTRRITLIGQSNDINQQNFSSQDLGGISGGGGRGAGGGMGGGRGFGGGGGRGPMMGGGSADNFTVGNQGGINSTHALGINYNDNWGKKTTIAASYFFNSMDNISNGIIKRFYYLPDGSNQYFDQTNKALSSNLNHRFNGRLEYNIDSCNSIILTPNFSFQKTTNENITNGNTTLSEGAKLNNTNNNFLASNNTYNFSNNILFNHKFKKAGRSYSINIGNSYNKRDGNNQLDAKNTFFIDQNETVQNLSQKAINNGNGSNINSNISFSEPIGKKAILQVEYKPSWNTNKADQITNQFNNATLSYDVLDTNLSNQFNSQMNTQAAGLTYRFKSEKTQFNLAATYQMVDLTNKSTLPNLVNYSNRFYDILPGAMYQYNFENKANVRFFYRTFTAAPSVNQLQNAINNSNPLSLTTGNPNLVQSYSHFGGMRFNHGKVEKGTSFFVFMGGGYNANYIANSSLVASADTMLNSNIMLRKGGQLTQPVNLDGFWNFRSFSSYGFPLKWIKSNFNINFGFNYTRTPGLVNNVLNKLDNYNLNASLVLSSNISKNVDFSISYSPNYTIIQNFLQANLNNNFVNTNSNVRVNIIPWKGLVINSDITNTVFSGLGEAYNQNFWLWNAGLGYKFLKSKAAEVRISVYDLLNQNNSAGRFVTETYTEDNRTDVLRKFYMLTFTYNIRKSNQAKEKLENKEVQK